MSTLVRPSFPKTRPIAWEVFAICSVTIILCACSKKSAEQVPIIAQLPAPSLVDQDRQVFEREAMEGKLWVTSFLFTHCRATCPRLMAQMKKLQGRVSNVPSAQLLSVSVDPQNDTPEVIKAYMRRNGFDESNWRFVTGDENAVQDFVVGGFKVGYGQTRWSTELTHPNSLALVDDLGRIRGYYRSDDEGLAELERDLRAIAP